MTSVAGQGFIDIVNRPAGFWIIDFLDIPILVSVNDSQLPHPPPETRREVRTLKHLDKPLGEASTKAPCLEASGWPQLASQVFHGELAAR